MPIVTGRKDAAKVIESLIEKNISMAIFCTASHWNTEAILLAAKKFCDKHHVETVPLAISMTFNYSHMPQARRVTHTKDAKLGFLSVMEHLHLLCDNEASPYRHITVLPHLDHANPDSDSWALTEGSKYLASAMLDAQTLPPHRNIEVTRDYVANYGRRLLVEGIIEELAVSDSAHQRGKTADGYLDKAVAYVKSTGIDFLVADLGTEQQATASGGARYLKERAGGLTSALGRKMLVLHGASSLDQDQMGTLTFDGVVRVNMWTKIVREAGKHAACSLFKRADALFGNDFESVESNRYLMDSIDKASDMMLEILETLNYASFALK